MHHHTCCAPTGWDAGGGCAPWPGYPMPAAYYYYVPCCAACGQPNWLCRCDERLTLWVPQEIVLGASPAATTVEIVIGGVADVQPILEYLPDDGAAAPEVTVEQLGAPVTTLFHETAITAGYHVKENLAAVAPGAKLRLTATECFARLRWCERMEY